MNKFIKFICLLLLTSITACLWYAIIPIEAYQIAKGITAGSASLPYYVYSNTTLEVINDEFKKANAKVTIEDVYKYSYEKPFKDLPPDGDTGQKFSDMATATKYLQNILKAKGVSDSGSYFMTSIDSAKAFGFTLIAAVKRTAEKIALNDKFSVTSEKILTCDDPLYYQPYRFDCNGNPIDTVYEWAAVPNDCFDKQGHQAILLTLMANKLLEKSPKTNYWEAERKWIAGDYISVVIDQDYKVCQELGIEEGYTQRRNLINN